jgi:hypothetical protein
MYKSALLSCTILTAAFDNPVEAVTASGPKNSDDNLNEWVGRRAEDSAAMLPYWLKVSDIVKGADAIRDAGECYLPRFPNELKSDYEFRQKNAKFTNIFRDIVEALASKPFEQEVRLVKGDGTKTKTIPQEIEDFCEDVDGSGNNLTVHAAQLFFTGIASAVGWIFIDYPDAPLPEGRSRTRAEEKALGIRPFWSHVLPENVLEATSQIINGKERWTMVRIYEPGSPNKVRVLQDNGLEATWALYREEIIDRNKKKYVLEKDGKISIGIIPLVQFATGRRDGRRYFFHPPMRDAADLQIELYQAETGLKFAKTLTAYPMLAGNGVKPEKDAAGKPLPVGIGPGRVVYAPPDGAGGHGTWAFIEPGAQSLKFLQEDIDATIKNLRELGRQPLTAQSGNLTVITTAVAAGKARSAVSNWSLALKNALENALVITGKWLSLDESKYSPEVNVYTDFDDFTDDDDNASLDAMRKNRDLSQETYWEEKKRRGVLSSEFDAERERQRLLDEMPGDEFADEDQENNDDPNQPRLPGLENDGG